MTYLPFKVRTKLALKKVMPTFAFNLLLGGWRATFSKLSSSSDMDVITEYTKEFLAKYGHNVVGGPFTGMKYINEAAGSGYLTKLVGVYEEILHEVINKVVRRNYTTMIDIGCAEGYYLIGVGMANEKMKLIGYDIDKNALRLTRELYAINNLSNELILIDKCTPQDLSTRIDDNTFLICDAEGFENEILNPTLIPELVNVKTYIVELHDFVIPHIKETLITRFEKSHTIKTVVFKNGNPSHYPFLMGIQNKRHLYTILRERGEQEQEWLVMESKNNGI